MGLKLTYKQYTSIPIDLSLIQPTILGEKSIAEIKKLELYVGNKTTQLSTLFDIEELPPPDEFSVTIKGDLNSARRIGYEMDGGKLTIEGNGGLYVGERMKSGELIVNGNVGSWAGSSMKGGALTVNGNAGDFLGASYRGSRTGLKGGSIIVNGDVGCETGGWMNGGLIHIKGSAQSFLGVHMQDGFIVSEGDCEARAGAQMTGGRIAVLGKIPGILPSFGMEELRGHAELGPIKLEGPFYMFTGDNNEGGSGRLYLLKKSNEHLSEFEKYLGQWE